VPQNLAPRAAQKNVQKEVQSMSSGRTDFAKNLLATASLVIQYASKATLGKFRIRDAHSRMRFFSNNVGTYTRRVLENFNFDLKVVGHDPASFEGRNFLLVSNHLSYLDILVLSSVQPCVFVTSVDLGESFFLGQMAELGGSLFIERRHRAHIGRDIGVMADTLRAGHNVVIFPEGTSSNGEGVLPFKKALLNSAIDAGVDILPVVIKYTEINGEPFNLANRDLICWHGDTQFFPHFMGVLKVKSVKAELHFLEPIPVTKESTRHDLAATAYKAITAIYGHPLSSNT
jgi:1-acyl-sn-glycerol-3-phosphate acyltransferase